MGSQPGPPAVDGLALDDERLRLEAQLVETDELLEEALSRATAAATRVTNDSAALMA